MWAEALVHGPPEISQLSPSLDELASGAPETPGSKKQREAGACIWAHRMPGPAESRGGLGRWQGHSTHLLHCPAEPLIPRSPRNQGLWL